MNANPNAVFPNEYGTTCFLKNVVTAPNIFVGDYTYYDDPADPTGFEANNVLFNWPEFGDKLIIGKFCCIASGTQFLMGPANHRMCSATTYPFAVFGGAWAECAPPHLSQLPLRGTSSWATTSGWGATQWFFPAPASATARSSPRTRWSQAWWSRIRSSAATRRARSGAALTRS